MSSEENGFVSYSHTFTHLRHSLASAILLAWQKNKVLYSCLAVKQWVLLLDARQHREYVALLETEIYCTFFFLHF